MGTRSAALLLSELGPCLSLSDLVVDLGLDQSSLDATSDLDLLAIWSSAVLDNDFDAVALVSLLDLGSISCSVE